MAAALLSHFTQEELGKFKDAFREYDTDKDDQLSLAEVNSAMIIVGWKRLTPEELGKYFKLLGKDSHASVDAHEFCILLSYTYRKAEIVEQVERAFDRYDFDEDGYINARDLQNAMLTTRKQISKAEAQKMIDMADVLDKDGKLSFDEFYRMMSIKRELDDSDSDDE